MSAHFLSRFRKNLHAFVYVCVYFALSYVHRENNKKNDLADLTVKN